MIWTDFLMVCGVAAGLFTSGSLIFSLTSVLCFLVYIQSLRVGVSTLRESQSSFQKTEKVLRAQVESLTVRVHDSETALRTVLQASSEGFCVYSEDSKTQSLAEFCNFAPAHSCFWKEFLDEKTLRTFYANIRLAQKGQLVSMQVKFMRQGSSCCHSVLHLSPILEAMLNDPRDAVLDLKMSPIPWDGGEAVLLHLTEPRHRLPVHDFVKTLNHEFRTPLNIIIGLSDLVLADSTPSETHINRQRLVKQCASTMLATISSIIQQCEAEWKLPTALHHTGFNPQSEIALVVSALESRLAERDNVVRVEGDETLPKQLWGNVIQFRHALSFMLQTCSSVTERDTITLRLKNFTHNQCCDIQGDIEASCPALCSASDFRSVLELLSSEEGQPAESVALSSAERQALLNLSIAREMCKLFCGDMQVRDSSHFCIHFWLSFSQREKFILKRKGHIFGDREEFVKVESPCNPREDEFEDDCSPVVREIRRSSTQLSKNSVVSTAAERRRYQTCPSNQLHFGQVPFSCGDADSVTESPHCRLALIAEDIPMNAAVLRSMIGKLGLRSISAANGAEALSLMQRYTPDIVFMDCQMPVMDGLEATRRIRETNQLVPIVAVTADGPEREAVCKEAGMNFFLSKPVLFSCLAALLQRLHLVG